MSRDRFATILLSSSIGSVATLAILLISGVAWSSDEVPKDFCPSVSEWRDLALALEITSNSVDRSSADGRSEMREVYKQVATIVIPSANGDASILSGLIAQWNAAEEGWLSANRLWSDVSAESSTVSTSARLEVFREMEDMRLTANDLLRRVNPLLVSVCSVPPVDPYLSN